MPWADSSTIYACRDVAPDPDDRRTIRGDAVLHELAELAEPIVAWAHGIP